MQAANIPAGAVPELVAALIDRMGFLNRFGPDMVLLQAAGVTLDRVLFPLLVVIGQREPIGVMELAGRAGRDYTTVSRQVAKLEGLGLVARRPGKADRRVHEAMVRTVLRSIDAAQKRLLASSFCMWNKKDAADLVRLMRRFAHNLAGAGKTVG